MKKVCSHDKKRPRPIVVSTHPRHFAYCPHRFYWRETSVRKGCARSPAVCRQSIDSCQQSKRRAEKTRTHRWLGGAEENELIILPADFGRLSLHKKLEKR